MAKDPLYSAQYFSFFSEDAVAVFVGGPLMGQRGLVRLK